MRKSYCTRETQLIKLSQYKDRFSSAITPIAGTLIARGYSRKEEFAADRHGMELLARAGYPPQTMERTLKWILSQEGRGGGGGFLSSHPATEDRIAALRK